MIAELRLDWKYKCKQQAIWKYPVTRAAPETALSGLSSVAATHKTYILPTKYETVNSVSANRLISYSILPYDLILSIP